jgi:hypothetical protein
VIGKVGETQRVTEVAEAREEVVLAHQQRRRLVLQGGRRRIFERLQPRTDRQRALPRHGGQGLQDLDVIDRQVVLGDESSPLLDGGRGLASAPPHEPDQNAHQRRRQQHEQHHPGVVVGMERPTQPRKERVDGFHAGRPTVPTINSTMAILRADVARRKNRRGPPGSAVY